jgi:flagellin
MAEGPHHKIVALDAARAPQPSIAAPLSARTKARAIAELLDAAVATLRDTRFVLQRMRVPALLAAQHSLGEASRATIQAQLAELAVEVDRAMGAATRDGSAPAGDSFDIDLGEGPAITFTLPITTAAGLGLTDASASGGLSVDTPAGAQRAVSAIEAAIEIVSLQQAVLGAVARRLDGLIAAMPAEPEGRIRDGETASEVADWSKAQILRAPSTALQAQAGAAPGVLVRFPKRPSR